jgi:hypothetical protein
MPQTVHTTQQRLSVFDRVADELTVSVDTTYIRPILLHSCSLSLAALYLDPQATATQASIARAEPRGDSSPSRRPVHPASVSHPITVIRLVDSFCQQAVSLLLSLPTRPALAYLPTYRRHTSVCATSPQIFPGVQHLISRHFRSPSVTST